MNPVHTDSVCEQGTAEGMWAWREIKSLSNAYFQSPVGNTVISLSKMQEYLRL
jgi:hypothetical protein